MFLVPSSLGFRVEKNEIRELPLVSFFCRWKYQKDVQHLLIHYQGKEIHSLDILFKQNGHVVLRKRKV